MKRLLALILALGCTPALAISGFNLLTITAKTPLLAVTTNGVMNNATFSSTGKISMIARIPVIFGGDVDSQGVAGAFDCVLLAASSGASVNCDQAITIQRLELEQDGGISVPATFSSGAATTLTLNPGDVDKRNDVITPSAFGLTKFSAYTKYYWRVCAQMAADGGFPQGANVESVGSPGAIAYYYDATRTANLNSCAQVHGTGPLTAPQQSNTDTKAYGPTATLGHFTNFRVRSIGCLGDSLTDINSETSNYAPSGPEFCSRAAMTPDFALTNAIAQIKLARAGSKGSLYVNNLSAQHYYQFINMANVFFGTNDIGVSNDSAATVLATLTTIHNTLHAAGVQKTICVGMFPRTTSTDQFLTEANQSYFPDSARWGPGSTADTLNQSLIAAVGTVCDAYYGQTVISGVDPWKWKVDSSTPNLYTNGGTHPGPGLNGAQAIGAVALGSQLRTIFLSQTVH